MPPAISKVQCGIKQLAISSVLCWMDNLWRPLGNVITLKFAYPQFKAPYENSHLSSITGLNRCFCNWISKQWEYMPLDLKFWDRIIIDSRRSVYSCHLGLLSLSSHLISVTLWNNTQFPQWTIELPLILFQKALSISSWWLLNLHDPVLFHLMY